MKPSPARLAAGVGAVLLEELYRRYNQPQYVYPDPLDPVLRFAEPRDQEIAGLIASSLAFGNVKQILRSVDAVLECFPRPCDDLAKASPQAITRQLAGFRHRYVGGAEMAALLLGVQRVVLTHGTLGACFQSLLSPEDKSVTPALGSFVRALREGSTGENYLLPDPARGSACKRLFMYLRWMVRKDAVDPGPWQGIPPRLLVVPIDTHMHRIAIRLGFTQRRSADLRTALEVTQAFRAFAPDDPVRYDFSLTRIGIRKDLDTDWFWARCGEDPARHG